jgi:16S rRNA processing protein RimM
MNPSDLPQQLDDDSGSPTSGEPDFLVVGKLGRPHGTRGEILMQVYTDFPERLQPGVTLYVGHQYRPLRLLKQRPHSKGMLVAFEGYQDRDEIATFRSQLVHVRASDRPVLQRGDYYHHQLLDLQVIDEADRPLGKISRILETGANDVIVVQDRSGTEILIPAIDLVILEIDLDQKQVRVHLLPGLLPEE